MLPRAHRLRDSRAFRTVYGRGRSWAGPLVVLHVLALPDDAVLVGISTSKKVGDAVQRNRVRRRLREAIRPWLPRVKRGSRLVLVARTAAREAGFEALRAAVGELLARAGIVSGEPCPSTRGAPTSR